ncbi:amidase 1 [Quillaja saponaria]|uniref:Amidase 1 n=1 Tax=Quillaja saponaria TaxID=32244 RepID=A0AAD7QB13_QUISA|nr:amidase 1 [Quillaja saponaria]
MDELAYSMDGENKHYGTPRNPLAPDRVPGGSSGGSAVAVGAGLVDFALGTNTGGSVRISGIILCFDTVGWFARDPMILNRVGQEKIYGGHLLKHAILSDYVKDEVPSLKHFISKEKTGQTYDIPSLAALSSAMRLLLRYEFKDNHGKWISTVKPDLGPGISEREVQAALSAFLGNLGVLILPTLPGPPPKLKAEYTSAIKIFHARAFSLLSIASVSGFCQVSIPMGMYNNLPMSISLVAIHGSDGFLLNFAESISYKLREEVDALLKTLVN